MNRQIITRRICDVRNNLQRLSNHLLAMDSLDIQRYPENYETMSTEAALLSEKVTCQMRNLLYATASIPKQEFLVRAGEIHDISIQYENGLLEIRLPRLLPKKKSRQSSLFLIDPLNAALAHYGKVHALPRFRECTVCICHVYETELPDWCLLDYDNLQQKQILDVIALHVMADDSGLLCDAFNTTELGKSDGTRIFVMEKIRFPEWLSGRQKEAETTSDFC